MYGLYPSCKIVNDPTFPFHEVALQDMLSCITDKSEIEGEVVDAGNLQCEEFLSLEQMVQVGLGIEPVNLASVGVDR